MSLQIARSHPMEFCRGAGPCADRDGRAARGGSGKAAAEARAGIPALEPAAGSDDRVEGRGGERVAGGTSRRRSHRAGPLHGGADDGWAQGDISGFGLHSGYHTSIRPEQWREGKYSFGRLTARDWEFIDIRVPRFLVKAIWPDYIPEPVRPANGAADEIYTTPYLDLMQAAIAQFGITPENQGKKDCLMDWFLEQQVEGEPVSNKLADAMATLIRLPSAQRGGGEAGAGARSA